jgi:hypothetical protein
VWRQLIDASRVAQRDANLARQHQQLKAANSVAGHLLALAKRTRSVNA